MYERVREAAAAGAAAVVIMLAATGVSHAQGSAPEPGKSEIYQSYLPRAGNRIFLEPVVAKDADIDNQVNFIPVYGWAGKGHGWQVPLSIEKRLTPRFSLQAATQLNGPSLGEHGAWYAQGWAFQGKYLYYLNDPHEIYATAIIKATAPSGPKGAFQSPWSSNEYLVFNKGFGDLPQKWLRPWALQSDVAAESPYGDAPGGRYLRTDLLLEYSFLYLHEAVGIKVPWALRHFVPSVEWDNRDDWAQGSDGGFVSWEMNWQTQRWQISLAYQNPYSARAPSGASGASFAGTRVQLYVTWFYDFFLKGLGFNPTPY